MCSSNDAVRHYAVRRLNPFQGVIQVLQILNGRAISLDGVHWELQVESKRPDDLWGAESPGEPVLEYLQFGSWSESGGLRKVPAHPFLDLTGMMRTAEALIGQLKSETLSTPFPLVDRFELWLLDKKQRLPLALIASSTVAPDTSIQAPGTWECADKVHGDFDSPNADDASPSDHGESDPHPHISALERAVNAEAGDGVSQWFERQPEGDGIGLVHPGKEELNGRLMKRDQFPELLLREKWNDRYEQLLVADYLAWTSPVLLELQLLSRETRQRLEQAAQRHALEVDANWRLYPEIIEQGFLKAARVEARLRNATR
ncbi:MAG: hypothetical protein ABW072_04000 [Sedimenticola sp.]